MTVHRRQALQIGAILAGSALYTACGGGRGKEGPPPTATERPTPTLIPLTTPEAPKTYLGYDLLSGEELTTFLNDAEKGAIEPLTKLGISTADNLTTGKFSTNPTLSQMAIDPFRVFKVNEQTALFQWNASRETSNTFFIDSQTGLADKLYNTIELAIGMPLDELNWKKFTSLIRALIATKEVINAGVVDAFARSTYDELTNNMGFSYALSDENGNVLTKSDDLTEADKLQIGMYLFLANLAAQSPSRGPLWRMFDMVPMFPVCVAYQHLLSAGALTEADELVPTPFAEILNLGNQLTIHGQTALEYFDRHFYQPLVDKNVVNADVTNLVSVVYDPEFVQTILTISLSDAVYGPLSRVDERNPLALNTSLRAPLANNLTSLHHV